MTLSYTFINRKYVGGVILKDIAIERAMALGEYIAENNATVRETARVYRVSK